jgi:transposase
VLSVEDWAKIRWLHRAERMPIRQVARVMGCSKNTVKRALAGDGPPRYQAGAAGSIVDAVEPRIRELLQAWPTMPATVIAERIGWTHGLTVLKDRAQALRPVHPPPDPASRTAYGALWHVVPLVQAHHGAAWIAWKCLETLAARVLIVWLYNNTGESLFAAFLFHALTHRFTPVDRLEPVRR